MKKDILQLSMIFENMVNRHLVYHVTSKHNLTQIQKQGLIPKVPEDYGENGDEIGIYCFPSRNDVENALMNWLGERIEDWEDETGKSYDEVLLILDISGLSFTEDPDVGYEIIVKEPITPDRILKVESI